MKTLLRSWLWLSLCLLLCSDSQAESLQRYHFERPLMGTLFRIELYAPAQALAVEASNAAFEEVEAINAVASDYLPHSEISRFNQHFSTAPFPASPRFFELVKLGVSLHGRTQGAFDITTDYSIQAWRRAKRQGQLPSESVLKKALAMTDVHALELDPKRRTITKRKSELRINLGGLGKGYAADRALQVLRVHGITRAMVAGSGDLAIGDAPPQSKGWKVTLRTQHHLDPAPQLVLANCGVSTSGDMQQFFVLEGRTYSHIIDPKNGLGLTHRISCTVIAANATLSDSFDNAMCVLGIESGLKLLEQEGMQGRFTQLLEDGRLEIRTSPDFAKHQVP